MSNQPSSRFLDLGSENLLGLWGEEGARQIRIRWAVPPLIVLAVWVGRWIGFEVRVAPILSVAVASALYNSVFALILGRYRERVARDVAAARVFTFLQVVVDYAAMLLLIYFTGGVWSPLVYFLIFHVILAAIHFSSRMAYLLAALAAGGVWLILALEGSGMLAPHPISYRGRPIHAADSPADAWALLTVFTISLFLAAALISRISRRQEARVQEMTRERALFTLELAHNLRAPLAASLSLLELVKDGTLGVVGERQAGILERIDGRLRALHQTIGELLAIGRALDREHEIPDVVVSPAALAAHTDRMFRAQAEGKGLHFAISVESNLPDVESGADLLEKILENLVSNAIKYTEEGSVEVRFERRADALRIAVSDTGIGIPTDEQGRLFTEFFRASNARELTSSGTGLGLALAKQSVERHDGRVEVRSEEGAGTTVVVDIPILQSPRQPDRGAIGRRFPRSG